MGDITNFQVTAGEIFYVGHSKPVEAGTGVWQVTYHFSYEPAPQTDAASMIEDLPNVSLGWMQRRRANRLGDRCCAELKRIGGLR
jgi:hypothetical protein